MQGRIAPMNDLFVAAGIESWKPFLSALFSPPLPFLALVLIGARWVSRRRAFGTALVLFGCAGTWLSMTPAVGAMLIRSVEVDWPPLTPAAIDALVDAPNTAIVVLGGGRREFAAEYDEASLTPRSIERLRYGIWLARATHLPLAFSGGVGWRAKPGPAEADIAAKVAEREFGVALRWKEARSRDTRENAVNTIELLKPYGVRRIVLVTNGSDMRRAVGNFERAATGDTLEIVPAPMDIGTNGPLEAIDWLPSPEGYSGVHDALHEWAGLAAGA